MKATFKPTDKPGMFGITIDDITVEEAAQLLNALSYYDSVTRRSFPAAVSNNRTLRPVIEAGIEAV